MFLSTLRDKSSTQEDTEANGKAPIIKGSSPICIREGMKTKGIGCNVKITENGTFDVTKKVLQGSEVKLGGIMHVLASEIDRKS